MECLNGWEAWMESRLVKCLPTCVEHSCCVQRGVICVNLFNTPMLVRQDKVLTLQWTNNFRIRKTEIREIYQGWSRTVLCISPGGEAREFPSSAPGVPRLFVSRRSRILMYRPIILWIHLECVVFDYVNVSLLKLCPIWELVRRSEYCYLYLHIDIYLIGCKR